MLEKENGCRFCIPAAKENGREEMTHAELDFGMMGKLLLSAGLSGVREPKIELRWLLMDRDDVILEDDGGRAGLPVNYCPVCGRKLRDGNDGC